MAADSHPDPQLPPLRPVLKVWLDRDGKAFGEGPCRLLEGVERSGSLRQAAADLRMSYNKAWRMVRALEGKLGYELLERTVGGHAGGGSCLTERARELLVKYAAFEHDAQEAVGRLFAQHFGDVAEEREGVVDAVAEGPPRGGREDGTASENW
ncbi:MAG: LysR family transcriptional regulator [Actinobacteria bacterium]|nr:LysR family transcriptional regulator [Actinomycetota bacterium]